MADIELKAIVDGRGRQVFPAGHLSTQMKFRTEFENLPQVMEQVMRIYEIALNKEIGLGSPSMNVRKAFYQGMKDSLLVTSDFLENPPITNGITVIPAGAGAGIVSSAGIDKTNHPGVWTASTGSTAAGRLFFLGPLNVGFHLGVGGVTRVGTWIRTAADLSDAVNEYVLRSGVFNIGLPNTIISGIGFEYQFDQNLGRWQGLTVATGEEALLTLAEVEVDTWYYLESEVNADGSSVEFFINHVSVGTLRVAANIPSGTGINHFYSTHIMKLLGTAARYLSIDAYYLYQELPR